MVSRSSVIRMAQMSPATIAVTVSIVSEGDISGASGPVPVYVIQTGRGPARHEG